MKQTSCRVSGCDRSVSALDMCKAHYSRNYHYGDPMADVPVRNLIRGEKYLETGHRVCRRCKASKSLEEFSPRSNDKPEELAPYCKPCASAFSSSWNKKNPDKTYDAHLRRTYGITLEQYQAMSMAQANACRICLIVPDKRLNVHHNHDTGEVVGLICWNCNSGLGKFKDSPELLRRAALFHEGKL